MDGSETGWGRPAEPAPRWRALLDRARLGTRGVEQDRVGHRVADDEYPAAPVDDPLPLPRRSPENGYAGRATGLARPADPFYRPDPGHPPAPAFGGDPAPAYGGDPAPAYGGDPAPAAESRYALLDNRYREAPVVDSRPADPPAPVESRYALLANGYQREPVYQASAPVPAAPAYPPRLEWRQQAPVSETERATGVLRRDFGSPRVLAFANPKGGVHKTTATVLAAATVGSVRGRGVIAWDDNELRGTLGLRAGSARHARTIRHLIADLAQVEIRNGADLVDTLDDYLRHASDGSYDVLAGEESPRFAQRLDQFTVKRVLELLRRTHEVICVDTGNNVESANWQTVMRAADQLVLTTVPREDAAFSADWMLDLLHEIGMGELADNAVTLISCATPGRSPLQDDLERHFATRTRAVAVVPYDPALETGSSIEYHQLRQETRDAWLRAAAVMLEPFAR